MKKTIQKYYPLCKFFTILSVITLLVGIIGCARNVSGQPTDQLFRFEINITFAEPPDLDNYLYYIIFSTRNPPTVPSEITQDYFFTPGRNFNPSLLIPQDDVSPYYRNYFSTWSDFIVINRNNTADMYNAGPSAQFNPNTTNNHTYTNQDGFRTDKIIINENTLSLQFTLQSLSENIHEEDTLYFTIVTTLISPLFSESGTILDTLENSEPSVLVPSTFRQFNDNSDGPQLTPQNNAGNIISWEARIF